MLAEHNQPIEESKNAIDEESPLYKTLQMLQSWSQMQQSVAEPKVQIKIWHAVARIILCAK